MIILGISSGYHDSSAALIRDGKIIACAQEERFTRIKGDKSFPISAINFCCQEAGILTSNIDAIAFYEKPYLKFHRSILSHIESYPFSYKHFMSSIKSWLGERLNVDLTIQDELSFDKEPFFIPHHLAHAASSTFVSPFEEAAFIVSDGVGEWATISYGIYKNNQIKILEEQRFPNSVGLIYSAVTYYLGFSPNGGEGKVMGLADYGKPIYLDKFLKTISLNDDGSFIINEKFWDFKSGREPVTKKFIEEFGEIRQKGSELKKVHYDIAASLQALTELILLKIANYVYQNTKMENLCLSGGSFLNIPTNSEILKQTSFNKLFVQPAAGDAGAALGAALFLNSVINKDVKKDILNSADLGPSFTNEEIERQLVKNKLSFKKLSEDELIETTCRWLSENHVVAWFQGKMEFGPRALGRRSILANPSDPNMKDYLNLKVKKREPFRPYGISILENLENKYLLTSRPEEKKDYIGPFMLKLGEVREEYLTKFPSAAHIDKSTRYQTVTEKDGLYYKLLKTLDEKYNLPFFINTSFNLDGEPVVCTPEDACKTFKNSIIKKMVIGGFVVEKV